MGLGAKARFERFCWCLELIKSLLFEFRPTVKLLDMRNINLVQLKAATAAGGVTGITLQGDGAAFVVSVQTQRD